jgi:predicted nucleic-acid-binding protein
VVAVDTNVLLRLLVDDDPAQTARAEKFVAQGGWVSHIVLVEAVWVLKSAFALVPKQLMDLVEGLTQHQTLVLQDVETVEAALAYFRARPSLGFSDCMVLATAKAAGHTPLATFDSKLLRLPDTARVV